MHIIQDLFLVLRILEINDFPEETRDVIEKAIVEIDHLTKENALYKNFIQGIKTKIKHNL